MNKRTFAVLACGILAANLATAQTGAPGPAVQLGPAVQAGPAVQQRPAAQPGSSATAQGQPNQPAGRGPGLGMGNGNNGMMGGPGHEMMMGGFGTRNIPDLTPDQRSKITSIRRDLRNRQLGLMDQMHDQWAGTNYYRNGQFDEQAARHAYDATEKIHRQMFENSLDAQKRIDALLTPAQKQQLQKSYSGQP
jgi:Spy/CpxP family protein refolding chaperone